jgi:SAM-dependent methyltransferase
MMEVAKKIMNGGKGVDWKVMDAQVIEFNDGSFDTAVCQFGIMFFPDKQKSVNEVHRILKPGGKYLFSTWDKIEKQRTAEITRDVVNTFFKDDPTTFFDVPFAMYEPEVMEGLMKNSGFTNVTVKNVQLEGTSPSAEEAAKGFVMGNPIYFEICRRDATLLHEIMKAVEKEFAREFGEKSLRIPLSLWVTEGTK